MCFCDQFPSQVVNTLKRALIICISIQAPLWTTWHMGKATMQHIRSSGIGSTCWHSWALSSAVGPLLHQFGAHSVLRCSIFHISIMFLNSGKFLHFHVFLQTFFPSLYERVCILLNLPLEFVVFRRVSPLPFWGTGICLFGVLCYNWAKAYQPKPQRYSEGNIAVSRQK